ncbi:MAG TPA: glycosyltransferase family 2 protein [Chryseosolibacter sp.]|nr:glycosyltransferase family 2 protein [Chryseosolibacter sp.]
MKQNGRPLVSVILCFFNEEKFLEEAIQSVIAQDYDRWELITVDDGSSDASTEIAKNYHEKHPEKIFYIHHPGHINKGLSASRNAGIREANGEYIAFLDADDVWLPGKLSSQVKIFKKHRHVTAALEASCYWKSWMDSSEADIVIPVGVGQGVYSPPRLMTSLYPLGQGAAPCPSGIMVHRMVLRRCNFEETFQGIYQMYEDQAFLCKVYLKETVFVSAACNNKYRQRPSSLVSSVHQTGKYHLVRRYYLKWFEQYLRHQPVDYKVVNRLLDRALMPYNQPLWHKVAVEFPGKVKDLFARLLIRVGVLKYRKTW